jgi:hypothetical protein
MVWGIGLPENAVGFETVPGQKRPNVRFYPFKGHCPAGRLGELDFGEK